MGNRTRKRQKGGDGLKLELNHSPQKSLEFENRHFFYLLDVAKYVRTHLEEKLNLGSTNYAEIKLTWRAFLKLAVGKYNDQYDRFVKELIESQRYCYIPCPKEDGGGYYIMPPFRLEFKTVDVEKLPATDLQRLKNIGMEEVKHDEVIFGIAKPLLKNTTGSWYQHPINLTAKIVHILQEIEKEIKNQTYLEKQFSGVDLRGYKVMQHCIKFIDYLYQHGAGEKSKISVNREDLVKRVFSGGYIKTDKKGKKHMYVGKVSKILTIAGVTISKIEGLDYRLVADPITKKIFIDHPTDSSKMVFILEHETQQSKKNCT